MGLLVFQSWALSSFVHKSKSSFLQEKNGSALYPYKDYLSYIASTPNENQFQVCNWKQDFHIHWVLPSKATQTYIFTAASPVPSQFLFAEYVCTNSCVCKLPVWRLWWLCCRWLAFFFFLLFLFFPSYYRVIITIKLKNKAILTSINDTF